MIFFATVMGVLAIGLAAASGGQVALVADEPPVINVFDLPAISDGARAVQQFIASGNEVEAQALLTRLTQRFPAVGAFHYDLAVLLARAGKVDEALQSLTRAVDDGLPGGAAMLENNPAFDSLRQDPRFQALVTSAGQQAPQSVTPPPTAAEVTEGIAPISAANTGWDSRFGVLRTLFHFPQAAEEPQVMHGNPLVADRLNAWFQNGSGAGNYGDLYDNRDRGHSKLQPGLFPQVARVQYGDEARAAGIDRAMNTMMLFNAPTVGNASLADTAGPLWRSLPRDALTRANQVAVLALQYAANQIYVYPEHHDHDPDLR